MYVHQAYPSTRYHRDGRVQGVNDPAHELEVAHPEDGWADTPAAFLTDEDATEGATNDAPVRAPKRKR
jgi:hypothetical protein